MQFLVVLIILTSTVYLYYIKKIKDLVLSNLTMYKRTFPFSMVPNITPYLTSDIN